MIRFCSFASSSSGNCSFYLNGRARILIDAGTNLKHIAACLREYGLTPADLTHILITHAHSDHVSALPVLLKHTRAEIVCSEETFRHLPVRPSHYSVFRPGAEIELLGCRIGSFRTPHDAAGSCGYIIGEGEQAIAYCTDLGYMDDAVFAHLCKAKTVFLESNHDVDMLRFGPYPRYLKQRILSDLGHLSNAVCAETVERLAQRGVRQVILAHLSDTNNTPECAYRESQKALRRLGAEREVQLSVAGKKEMSGPVVFD